MSGRITMEKTIRQIIDEKISEKDFQQQIIDTAKLLGWKKIYHTWNSKRSASGFPDLIMARDGIIIFAELKREGEDPTPAQREWLEELAKCEHVKVFIWKPSIWDEIVKVLG